MAMSSNLLTPSPKPHRRDARNKDDFITIRSYDVPSIATAVEWVPLRRTDSTNCTNWRLHERQLQVEYATAEISQQGKAAMNDIWPEDEDQDENLDQDDDCDPVPSHVPCAVRVDTKDCAVMYSKFLAWTWLDTGFYSIVEQLMEAFVQNQGPSGKEIYRKAGRVCLLEKFSDRVHEVSSVIVESTTQWRRQVPKMIVRYLNREDVNKFFLEVRTDYEWFVFRDSRGSKLEAVRSILEETAEKNFMGQWYWPKKVLRKLFSTETITGIIQEDYENRKERDPSRNYPDLDDKQISQFCVWVENDRYPHLAAIICSRNEISSLYKLKQTGLRETDTQSFFKPEILSRFLKDMDSLIFKRFWGYFRPLDLPSPKRPKHMVLHADEVVPVYYDKNEEPLGTGGFGQVYKATVHGDFHEFSSNKNEIFALKIIKGTGSSDDKARKEMETWEYVVRKPHDHIAKFHASWTQLNCFYILSPLACGDLDNYMQTRVFDFADIKWLLEQLEGLTSAVQHIHHIGRAMLRNSRSSGTKFDFGYHHDIKPSNILIFSDRTMKISDFGTVKIHHAMSGPSNRTSLRTRSFPKGDPNYEGPDQYFTQNPRKGPGQEYDIWSFGCVLLEVLTWMFCQEKNAVKVFRDKRGKENPEECQAGFDGYHGNCKCVGSPKLDEEGPSYSHSDGSVESDRDDAEDAVRRKILVEGPGSVKGCQSFWFWCTRGEQCHRKRCVQEQLDRLEPIKRQKGVRWLSSIYDTVDEMLDINPQKRPKASNLLDTLGALRVKARCREEKELSLPNGGFQGGSKVEKEGQPSNFDDASSVWTEDASTKLGSTVPQTRKRKRESEKNLRLVNQNDDLRGVEDSKQPRLSDNLSKPRTTSQTSDPLSGRNGVDIQLSDSDRVNEPIGGDGRELLSRSSSKQIVRGARESLKNRTPEVDSDFFIKRQDDGPWTLKPSLQVNGPAVDNKDIGDERN